MYTQYYELVDESYGWTLTFLCDDKRRKAFITAGLEKLAELESGFMETERLERETKERLERARKEQDRLDKIYDLMTPEERERWNATKTKTNL